MTSRHVAAPHRPAEPATLGRELDARRRRRVVGRDSERELFESALDAVDRPFSVLFVHGPGGIGKTTLLDKLARSARTRGASVVRVDGRSIVPSPDGFRDALGCEVSAGSVILIDAYEQLAPLDDWLRDELLPQLPADAMTVVAGRTPPSAGWRADPAWREMLRVVSLRNLPPEDARRYLRDSGVDPRHHDRLVAITHGHPLALSLVTDLVVRGGNVEVDALAPDLVAILLRRLVELVPDGRRRKALEVCALARVTTEALLRDVLQLVNARDLFEWLREQSFIETTAEGLVPHDLARDVLDVDLRWRDRATYDDVFRRVRAHVHHRLGSSRGIEQQRAIFDEKFVFRNLPSVFSPVDWAAWGESYPEPARDSDRETILALVESAEGDESAAIAAEWWRRQRDAFSVVRRHGQVRGFLALVTMTDDMDHAFDPGARAAWAYARRVAPPRPGELVTQTRFVIDGEQYQAPSPTLNATPILTMQRYLQQPTLAWDFLTLAEPDPLNDYFALADLPRADDADFVVGGRRYGLFAHDFRRVPVDVWLEVVTERALAQDLAAARAPADDALVLSQSAFTDGVRQALRDLHHPDRLRRNPLCRTQLIRRRGTDEPAAMLAALVREAIDVLRADPRDDKRWRALERTYVRPTPTQERAAEVLDLPFSTYRRHLTEGVARVVAELWDAEVYGPETQDPSH